MVMRMSLPGAVKLILPCVSTIGVEVHINSIVSHPIVFEYAIRVMSYAAARGTAEAVVRRAVKPDASFDARLGAVYLLLLLHEKQPGRPRRPVPVLSAQWEGFHRLATEMRTQRNADGFAAEYWCVDGAAVGCTDTAATNYEPGASIDDGSCVYTLHGQATEMWTRCNNRV